MKTIEGDGFSITFDETTGIMTGVYGKILSPEATASMYSYGGRLVKDIGVDKVRGLFFDFREVARFVAGNLTITQSESYRANNRFDMSNLPVALLVKTPMQEQMVRVSLRSTPGQGRKQIVHTEKDAIDFIEAWHAKQKENHDEQLP